VTKAIEAALELGLIGTSGRLSENEYQIILTSLRKNFCIANSGYFKQKNAPKKWQKRIFLNYKRVLEKLNLKRKTFLLENKSEKSENEFPEVSGSGFLNCNHFRSENTTVVW